MSDEEAPPEDVDSADSVQNDGGDDSVQDDASDASASDIDNDDDEHDTVELRNW